MTEQRLDDERSQTDEEWSEQLSSEAYRVLRESGTEPRFSSDGAALDVEADAE